MRALARIALLLAAFALSGAGCVSGSGNRDATATPFEGGAGDFYARVTSTQETMAGQSDAEARIATMNTFRDWLSERISGYEKAIVAQEADTSAQSLYDEMVMLQVTLNHIPRKTLHPDYCDIVRNSIYVAWAPNMPDPNPEAFQRPVREGLRFLDLLCAE